MRFARLTDPSDGQPVYVNLEKVVTIEWYTDPLYNETKLFVVTDSDTLTFAEGLGRQLVAVVEEGGTVSHS